MSINWTPGAIEDCRLFGIDREELERLAERAISGGLHEGIFKKSSGRRRVYVTLKDGDKAEVQFVKEQNGFTIQAAYRNVDQ